MEKGVFLRPAVAGELQKMVEARLHYDGKRGKEMTELQKKLLGTLGNPIYVVVDPKTGMILRRQDGASSEEEFLKFLLGTR